MSKAYLKGMLHDGTEREYTYRVSQKSLELIERIAEMVENLGFDAWTYEEGNRGVHVVEFSKRTIEDFELGTMAEKREYIQGYFDAEGSVPQSEDTRLYIYLALKDREDLKQLQGFVEEFGIGPEISIDQVSQRVRTTGASTSRLQTTTSSPNK